MKNYTEQQYYRLPKWAQAELTRLESSVNNLNNNLSYVEGDTETNTFVSEGLEDKPLPLNSHITFKCGRNSLSVYVRDNNTIYIKGNYTDDTMYIKPRASNAFWVEFKK